MLNYSFTEENYVKAIYHLQADDAPVNTNRLAEVLNTSAASATDMIKKLKKKKLVSYKPYYGCNLTTQGKSLALLIIRRHRLWEFFLCEKLGFAWNEVHEVAEELEHVGSEQLINRLDVFLGFPRTDPHGDPIPDAEGNIELPSSKNLLETDVNTKGTVVQIGQQSPALLELLTTKNISIGTKIKVIKVFPFDESMEVKLNNRETVHISKKLAENIFIQSL